jgi:hypothetical protein
MTPLPVAILALSGSVRLLLRRVPLLPFLSSGWAVSHWRSWAASRLQAFGALPGFLGEVGLSWQAVVLAVAGEHLLGGGFELVGLMGEVSPGATLGFGGVAGQLDAIDGEHFPADQALPVAEVKHLGKELGDLLVETGDEGGQRGEVGGAIAAERAMKVTCSRHSRSMPRLLTTPWA